MSGGGRECGIRVQAMSRMLCLAHDPFIFPSGYGQHVAKTERQKYVALSELVLARSTEVKANLKHHSSSIIVIVPLSFVIFC